MPDFYENSEDLAKLGPYAHLELSSGVPSYIWPASLANVTCPLPEKSSGFWPLPWNIRCPWYKVALHLRQELKLKQKEIPRGRQVIFVLMSLEPSVFRELSFFPQYANGATTDYF